MNNVSYYIWGNIHPLLYKICENVLFYYNGTEHCFLQSKETTDNFLASYMVRQISEEDAFVELL